MYILGFVQIFFFVLLLFSRVLNRSNTHTQTKHRVYCSIILYKLLYFESFWQFYRELLSNKLYALFVCVFVRLSTREKSNKSFGARIHSFFVYSWTVYIEHFANFMFFDIELEWMLCIWSVQTTRVCLFCKLKNITAVWSFEMHGI